MRLEAVSPETGMVMLLYLDNSFERFKREGRMRNSDDLWHAMHDGAVKRIRPKTMTVATAFIGLVPLMWATGAGADTMRRVNQMNALEKRKQVRVGIHLPGSPLPRAGEQAW